MLSHRYLPKPDDMGPDPEPFGARFDAICQAEALHPDVVEAEVVEIDLPPVLDAPPVPVAA